ncbi:MAG: nucleotidyl transferase AbiEii/AbiGii toxin family protein [Spirosomataceae bacterium]
MRYTLFFNTPLAKIPFFKGGTALSKCFSMIDRFSEDIDLVVLRREGERITDLLPSLKKLIGCQRHPP